jgi:hypothetical protein
MTGYGDSRGLGFPKQKFPESFWSRAGTAISQVGAIVRGIRHPNHHTGMPLDEADSP